MVIGQLLGYAASENNLHAVFLAKYGPEQRGGTASCTVTLSDTEIGAPVTKYVDMLIAMNQQSLNKFVGAVRPGGTVMLNSSLCKWEDARSDIDVINIPANEIAETIGSDKVSNIVMVGGYIEKTKVLADSDLLSAIKTRLAKKTDLLLMNEQALRAGMDLVKQMSAVD